MAFSYTAAVRAVLARIVTTSPAFGHVDLEKVVVAYSAARKRTTHGIYAKLVPLRFEGGALEGDEDGTRWRIDPFTFRGQDVLYILYVYLPRFHDQSFRDKLLTLFHELYHVGPAMDGDLRRFPGPNKFHGRSREWYDEQLVPHLEAFLDGNGSAPELDFLRESLETLEARHGGIHGTHVRQPTMRRVRVARSR